MKIKEATGKLPESKQFKAIYVVDFYLRLNGKKVFYKIQHTFMIKTSNKLGIEGMYLNIMKAIYDKSIDNIISNGES